VAVFLMAVTEMVTLPELLLIAQVVAVEPMAQGKMAHRQAPGLAATVAQGLPVEVLGQVTTWTHQVQD
jgi:hypothetical protein